MEPFIGEIMLWSGIGALPTGWLECNGATLQISDNDYSPLFYAIGTAFGGDGQSTFNVPDLRGQVAVGQGSDGSGNSYQVADSGGAESVVLTTPEMPAHTHTFAASTAAGTLDTPQGNVLATMQTNVQLYRPAAPTAAMAAGSIALNAGGTAHENRQPFIALTYLIAYAGVDLNSNA